MATLLQIDSSPLSSSVSRELTREFVSNWEIAHPSGQVIVRDLAANPPKPLDQAWIYAAHTPADALQPEQKAILSYSEECIAELERADEYVIGVAMHNFSIPSVVKLWIDQVVRSGRTFAYGGPRGAEGSAYEQKGHDTRSNRRNLRGRHANGCIEFHRSLPQYHSEIYRRHRRDLCNCERHGAAHVGKGRSRPVPAASSGAG